MKIVKDINKLIIKKIAEIVFVIVFVFFASYLWRSQNTKDFLESITSFQNLNYTSFLVEQPIDYSMFPMTDEKAMKNLKPCSIKVINETYTTESYALLLYISKESTMDYHFLHIGIDDKIYSLNDLEQKEDDENYVFILTRNSIRGDTKEYKIRLWLNTFAGNEMQAKELFFHFDLNKETTKV